MAESGVITYLILSLILCTWIALHLGKEHKASTLLPQVVEIELTSPADYSDNHQLLPSTAPMPSLRRRTSPDKITLPGSPFAAAAPPAVTPHPVSRARLRIPPNQPVAVKRADSPVLRPSLPNVPTAWATYVPAVATSGSVSQRQVRGAKESPLLLEEVAPPELIELVNNDGDQSLNLWQAGGSSTGGAGKRSNLAEYLKQLNRRIKAVWSPPKGETRMAEIIFRIGKDGSLLKVNLVRSSGDSLSDQSAMEAIAASAPFAELPPDYPYDFIDLKYDFRYSYDQLTEIRK